MSDQEIENNNKAQKVLKKSRESRRKILFWVFLPLATALVTLAVLYVFVWSQPTQPDIPEDMVVQAPLPSPSPTVTPLASAQPTPIATTQPETTPKPMVVQESFEELVDQNSDVVGWISVDNTDINYPIVQTVDNSFYMDKDFYKEYSYPGSIFVDFRSDFNNMFEAAHQIIYGHNMKNGTMFQQLTRYQEESFFNENRYINVNTLYGNYVFEVFAAYETPIAYYYLKTSFADRHNWLDFITVFQEKSDFQTDIVLSGNDVVVTLSTCTNSHNDNLRYVVQARLTNPERYDMAYDYIYKKHYE